MSTPAATSAWPLTPLSAAFGHTSLKTPPAMSSFAGETPPPFLNGARDWRAGHSPRLLRPRVLRQLELLSALLPHALRRPLRSHACASAPPRTPGDRSARRLVLPGRVPCDARTDLVSLGFEHPQYAQSGGRELALSYSQPRFLQNTLDRPQPCAEALKPQPAPPRSAPPIGRQCVAHCSSGRLAHSRAFSRGQRRGASAFAVQQLLAPPPHPLAARSAPLRPGTWVEGRSVRR